MNLHVNVAKSNDNFSNSLLNASLAYQYSAQIQSRLELLQSRKEFITTEMIDGVGRSAATSIALDNVLIYGSDIAYSQVIAAFIRQSFSDNHREVKIITASEFLSLSPDQRRGGNSYFVVICDRKTRKKNLNALSEFTGTQILFKIAGLDWEKQTLEVKANRSARLILSSLSIDLNHAVTIGLLASLELNEFCVKNKNNITKRTLSKIRIYEK